MKGKKLILILIIITGLPRLAWGLESTFYLSEESYPPERQEALVANLKELILYKHVLDLLLTKQKKALERLQSAQNETERKYWALMVLKYESLKLYCLTESLDCILSIQTFLNSNERNENRETLKYVHLLKKFIEEISASPIQLKTLEIIERRPSSYRPKDVCGGESGFEIWARLTKHYRILTHDLSKLTEEKEAL